MSKTVRVNLVGVVNLELDQLHEFQEDIKVLTDENYERMKAEILADGFSFSPHVFLDTEGKAWLLDGHQRKKTLTRMRDEEGYHVPTIPCMEVEAESPEHARALVLAAASVYGEFQLKNMAGFLKKASLEPGAAVKRFNLPRVNLEKLTAVSSHLRKMPVGAEEKGVEADHRCPKCGHEWDDGDE